jgi:hypothetical protein
MINNRPVTMYPIYESKERLLYFQRPHERKTFNYAFPVPQNRFIPFQFRRSSTPALITRADLVCVEGGYSQDLLSLLDESFIYNQIFAEGIDIVTLKMQAELTASLEGGIYYLEMEDSDGKEYWGELVKIICEDYDVCNCIAADPTGIGICADNIPEFKLGTL